MTPSYWGRKAWIQFFRLRSPARRMESSIGGVPVFRSARGTPFFSSAKSRLDLELVLERRRREEVALDVLYGRDEAGEAAAQRLPGDDQFHAFRGREGLRGSSERQGIVEL